MPRRRPDAQLIREQIIDVVRRRAGVDESVKPYSRRQLTESVGRSQMVTMQTVNEVLSLFGVGAMTTESFTAAFGDFTANIDRLRKGALQIRIHSMLFYGSLQRGFEAVRTETDSNFLDRPPWDVLPVGKRPDLATRIRPLNPSEAYACAVSSGGCVSGDDVVGDKGLFFER